MRDLEDLCRRLNLAPPAGPCPPGHEFPLLVPREYLAKIRPGDPRDPLLLQVLPQPAEDMPTPGYTPDPVGDLAAQRAPGVLQKYAGRVLILPTTSCAVHCRYCFRRNYLSPDFFDPGPESSGATRHPVRQRLRAALAVLRSDPSLREVILSGGDPLMVDDALWASWTQDLVQIEHIETLRIHTRLPVVIPSRIDDRFLEWVDVLRIPLVLVLHANHPREIDGALEEALAPLRRRGVVLLNQSVLLRHVNDDAEVLAELSRRLLQVGVLPYYLHQLDRALGTAHFAVSDQQAKAIVEELRARLPGYLVPRLVREEPGRPHKTPLA